MHFVYLLRSLTRPNKTYFGMTEDVDSRLKTHNEGLCPSTSRFCPGKLSPMWPFEPRFKLATWSST